MLRQERIGLDKSPDACNVRKFEEPQVDDDRAVLGRRQMAHLRLSTSPDARSCSPAGPSLQTSPSVHAPSWKKSSTRSASRLPVVNRSGHALMTSAAPFRS